MKLLANAQQKGPILGKIGIERLALLLILILSLHVCMYVCGKSFYKQKEVLP